MNRLVVLVCLLAASTVGTAAAQEGAVPHGIPHLDHVFVIMMENHGYDQVVGNPNDPFVNQYIKSANFASNYFAVGHPSLTNYLEVVADRTSASARIIRLTGTTPPAPPISPRDLSPRTHRPLAISARSAGPERMPRHRRSTLPMRRPDLREISISMALSPTQ